MVLFCLIEGVIKTFFFVETFSLRSRKKPALSLFHLNAPKLSKPMQSRLGGLQVQPRGEYMNLQLQRETFTLFVYYKYLFRHEIRYLIPSLQFVQDLHDNFCISA